MNSMQIDGRVLTDVSGGKEQFLFYPTARLPCWADTNDWVLPEPLSFSAFEREWCKFYRQHNEAPNALRVSPELEVTAIQLRNAECKPFRDGYSPNAYYRQFAIIVESDFDMYDWRLVRLARGDIIAGQAPEWEALLEQPAQRCRYCGRPAHKCGCGGAE